VAATLFTIVGLGEALFDLLPDRQVLGGAPLNVAVHAHQLAAPLGGRGVVVSRIGQDELAERVIEELRRRGMTGQYLQSDPDHDSGRVYVSVDAQGQPDYEIVRDVAWDWIQYDPDLEDIAHRCEAVCFGTIAQRNSQSRHTIYRFLDACANRAIRMFDVNLRQCYYDQNVLRRSCEFANVVKLNTDELESVTSLLAVGSPGDGVDDRIRGLIRMFDLRLVVLTRGRDGTVLYSASESASEKQESEPVHGKPAPGADAVGAGDACAAAVLIGLVLHWPMDRIVRLANHAGAYVASQPGATPVLPQSIMDMAASQGATGQRGAKASDGATARPAAAGKLRDKGRKRTKKTKKNKVT